MLGPLRDTAKLLSDRLGDDHDLALLRQLIANETDLFDPQHGELWLALIDQRRAELQAWALPPAHRLLAQKPKRLGQQLRRYWEAWRVEQRLSAALPAGSDAVS